MLKIRCSLFCLVVGAFLFPTQFAYSMDGEEQTHSPYKPLTPLLGAFPPRDSKIFRTKKPGEDSVSQRAYDQYEKNEHKLVRMRPIIQLTDSPVLTLGADEYFVTLQIRNYKRTRFLNKNTDKKFASLEEELNYHIQVENFTKDHGPQCDVCTTFYSKGECSCMKLGRDILEYFNLHKESSSVLAKYYKGQVEDAIEEIKKSTQPNETWQRVWVGAHAFEKMYYYSYSRSGPGGYWDMENKFYKALSSFISQNRTQLKPMMSTEHSKEIYWRSYFPYNAAPEFLTFYSLFNGEALAWKGETWYLPRG